MKEKVFVTTMLRHLLSTTTHLLTNIAFRPPGKILYVEFKGRKRNEMRSKAAATAYL